MLLPNHGPTNSVTSLCADDGTLRRAAILIHGVVIAIPFASPLPGLTPVPFFWQVPPAYKSFHLRFRTLDDSLTPNDPPRGHGEWITKTDKRGVSIPFELEKGDWHNPLTWQDG